MRSTLIHIMLGFILFFIIGCSPEEPHSNQESLTDVKEVGEIERVVEYKQSITPDLFDTILNKKENDNQDEKKEETKKNDSSIDDEEQDHNSDEGNSTQEKSDHQNTTESNSDDVEETDEASSQNDSGSSSSNRNSEQSNDSSEGDSNQNSESNENENDEQSDDDKKESESTVTVSITTGDVKGTILPKTEVALEDGDTALDVTQRIVDKKEIDMSVRGSGATAYVEGIDGLYEFDEGPLSGWHIRVDDVMIDRSSGIYSVHEGQSVDWSYTVNYLEDSDW
ncbi:DUF4430 domain-containing protein [Alkalibacillus haloalkaliphilus]|uniref:DUF4430 domain-containing protein n=1 Tax=Alkalibacillus haloalkaliphilus TaxID=94136 RepID=UPI0003775D69|nr:DUF4430 domain-containing protein [Alkalibacillus haloalkaliphilus]